MRNAFSKYDGLSYRDITWTMRGEGLPEQLIQDTLEQLREFRRARTAAKAKRRQADKQWGEVISALQHERKIVRSMLRYKTKEDAPERADFVRHYFDVLTTLYERLKTKKLAAQEMPPHDHWTDYVPEKIKDAFRSESYALPRRDRAKAKEPFERKLPAELHNLKKARLLRATHKQLNTVLEKLAQEPTSVKYAEQASAMRKALENIHALEPTDHVPNTWHAMVDE